MCHPVSASCCVNLFVLCGECRQKNEFIKILHRNELHIGDIRGAFLSPKSRVMLQIFQSCASTYWVTFVHSSTEVKAKYKKVAWGEKSFISLFVQLLSTVINSWSEIIFSYENSRITDVLRIVPDCGEVYFQNSSVRTGSENNCLFSRPVLKIDSFFLQSLLSGPGVVWLACLFIEKYTFELH